ncbi:5-carboxymethyl-2-hydroxymuconate isomerase [Pseudomonas sp. PA15(2017)]|uniref:5-carboxymethyl-2-hydroxymuconate Delta-isomerase n=1 Tax=Pseudomonas sp. PA15(2017) TaxID=1932111 RepID=UPI0009616115|nr:5-carboxymethyl-2-hydroxymuconate Delta-isomerase [Pseudomonas sp. PA15(2017)]OLU25018.1 5-carboxymethyl-2-hydroxymuconate isomerase [Pseudomonas sp. PA15(2017)]
MPHCLIEGSRSLLQNVSGSELVTRVHAAAMGSGLFKEGEVKVRLSLYDHFTVGGSEEDFVHVIVYLLAGRTDEQKKALSMAIVRALLECLPAVQSLSVDVRDMRREAFSNRRSCLDAG